MDASSDIEGYMAFGRNLQVLHPNWALNARQTAVVGVKQKKEINRKNVQPWVPLLLLGVNALSLVANPSPSLDS
jgi:hypothetical protein